MFIHSQKRNPQTHLKDANMVWDFFANHPMATHQVNVLFSLSFTRRILSHYSLCFFILIVVYLMAFDICMVMVLIHLKWLMREMNSSG